MYHLSNDDLNKLLEHAKLRYNHLIKANGFTNQAKNKLAVRNRSIDHVFSDRELIFKIGAYNGLCQIKHDAVDCEIRSDHYGKPMGTLLKKYGIPLNWFNDNFKAFLKSQLRSKFKVNTL